MKRTLACLIAIMILIFSTACNSNNDAITVKEGTYCLKQTGTDQPALQCINISEKDISFTYDVLSSYLPYGTYTIEDEILTMTTNDGKYKYLFKIDGEKLLFQENGSSLVNLIDDRFGIKITDNSEFKLKENK